MPETAPSIEPTGKYLFKRIGRVHFIINMHLAWLLAFGMLFIAITSLTIRFDTPAPWILLFSLPCLLIVSIVICRLRDMEFPAWTAILVLLPVVGMLFLIAMLSFPGTAQANRYGAPPAEPKRWMTAVAVGLAVLTLVGMCADFVAGASAGIKPFRL